MSWAWALALIITMSATSVFANEYQDALQFAQSKSREGQQLFQQFNQQDIPDFTIDPNEAHINPTQKGELEELGKKHIKSSSEANYLHEKARDYQGAQLDEETIRDAKNDYEKARQQSEKVACDDGACLAVKEESSVDFAEGIVELGALGEVAKDASDKQVKSKNFGIFGGANITCRVVFKLNRINFCRIDKHILSASNAEKKLHAAQKEGRAVRISGGTYCSAKRKILGVRVCVERRQSWCVFQSKLARIVQTEGRKQKSISFGTIANDTNSPNCRGLSPEEISSFDFDAPDMKSALSEMVGDYRAKGNVPSKAQASQTIEQKYRQKEGAYNDL